MSSKYENKTIMYGGTFHRDDQEVFPVMIKDIVKNQECILQVEKYPINCIQVSGGDDIYYTTTQDKNNTGEEDYYSVGIGINDKLIERIKIPAKRLLSTANNYIICAENERAIEKLTTMEVYSYYEGFITEEIGDVLLTNKEGLRKEITGLYYPKSFRLTGEDQHVYYTCREGDEGKLIKLSAHNAETRCIHDNLRTIDHFLLRQDCIFKTNGLLDTPIVTHDSIYCICRSSEKETSYSVVQVSKSADTYEATNLVSTVDPIYTIAQFNESILYTTGNEEECALKSLNPSTGEVRTVLTEKGIIHCVQPIHGTIELYKQIIEANKSN